MSETRFITCIPIKNGIVRTWTLKRLQYKYARVWRSVVKWGNPALSECNCCFKSVKIGGRVFADKIRGPESEIPVPLIFLTRRVVFDLFGKTWNGEHEKLFAPRGGHRIPVKRYVSRGYDEGKYGYTASVPRSAAGAETFDFVSRTTDSVRSSNYKNKSTLEENKNEEKL